MANPFHDVPRGEKFPKVVNMIVENPKGVMGKFEFDYDTEMFKLDRVSYAPMAFPIEYGFIPQTWNAGDGDSVDIMCYNTYPTFTGCLVEVRVLGMLEIEDSGEVDHKLLGVPSDDPHLKDVEEMEDLGKHDLDEIVFFWQNYKNLMPGKYIKILGWKGKEEAYKFLEECQKSYAKEYKK